MNKLILIITIVALAACSGGLVASEQPMPTAQATREPTQEPTTQPPTQTLAPTATPEPTPFVCNQTAGRIEQMRFNSTLTGGEVRYRVYLPPCYEETNAAYPVIYLLHGLGAGMDDAMWDTIDIDEAATQGYLNSNMPPVMLVMPNGNDAQHDLDTGAYADVIATELVPLIDTTYCTWASAEARAIGGLSRGGFWSYSVAFQYPEMFSKVGGHSGFFYEGDFPENNPYNLAATAPDIEPLEMYLDYGADDTIVNGRVEAFDQQLRTQRDIEPLFILNPSGAHNNEYWGEQSPTYLDWYTNDWPNSLTDYPACDGG